MRGFVLVCIVALGVMHGRAAAQAEAQSGGAARAEAAGPEADADDEAESEAAAGTAYLTSRAKVAVVVTGDPDAALVEAARAIRTALEGARELLLPGDAELAEALVGAPGPAGDDGLSEVRALRRRLALSTESSDVLVRLGRIAGAVALVLVERDPEPRLAVFDVGRSARFREALTVQSANEASIRRFVSIRAKLAARHAAEEAQRGGIGARTSPEAAAASAAVASAPEAAPSEHRRLVRRRVAYIAAGALLLAGGVFLLVDRLKDDPAPVLRIRPGGG